MSAALSSALDSNGDGVISRAEFAGATRGASVGVSARNLFSVGFTPFPIGRGGGRGGSNKQKPRPRFKNEDIFN